MPAPVPAHRASSSVGVAVAARAAAGPTARSAADVAALAGLAALGVPLGLAAVAAPTLVAGVDALAAPDPGDDPYRAHLRRPGWAVAVIAAGVAVDGAVTAVLAGRRPGPLRLVVAKSVGLAAGGGARFVTQRVLVGPALRRAQRATVDRPHPPGDLRLTVVVPAYQEEPRVGRTIRAIRGALDRLEGGWEVVVVDDGSTDGTAAAARAAGADVVIAHAANAGKGAAVRTGVAAARGRTVAFTDADLSYAPDHLLAVLAAVEGGGDLAMGNRRAVGSESQGQTGPLRRVGSLVFKWTTRLVLVAGYGDTQSGLKAFRSDVAHDLFGSSRIDGFSFDAELLHVAERRGYTVREVTVHVVHSTTSSIRLSRHVKPMVLDLLRTRARAAAGVYSGAVGTPAPVRPPADPPAPTALGRRTTGAG